MVKSEAKTTSRAAAKTTPRAAAKAAGESKPATPEEQEGKAPATKRAAKKPAAKTGAKSPEKPAATPAKGAGKTVAKTRGVRTAAETEKIREALTARLTELQEEHDSTLSELAELQRDRLTDSAGDDQADTGTKTFEREQEITMANAIRERIAQVERALERLDEGNYGWCERCGNPIPVERLAAFPSATLCVTCKQREERR